MFFYMTDRHKVMSKVQIPRLIYMTGRYKVDVSYSIRLTGMSIPPLKGLD